MPPTKVFVGNLSFKTKESELAEHFSTYKVSSVHIITRGPRSLGYGFIELENEELANQSVQEMNKKDIDGRLINVELAKPRQANTPKNNRPRNRGRGAAHGQNRNNNAQNAQNNNNQENNQNSENTNANAGTGAQNPKPKQNYRKRYRRPKNQQPKQANNNNNNNQQGQGQGQEGSPATRSPNQGQQGQQGQRQGDSPSRGRRRGGGRGPRGRGYYERPPRNTNRIESATALFVANLPFDLKEDKLLELFKEFNATKVHVVTNYQGRSRGFGFVEFANEKDQNEAFTKTNQNKIVISDRTMTVKLVQLKEKAPESVPVETTNTVVPATTLPTTATA